MQIYEDDTDRDNESSAAAVTPEEEAVDTDVTTVAAKDDSTAINTATPAPSSSTPLSTKEARLIGMASALLLCIQYINRHQLPLRAGSFVSTED
jgi:hypothetical protein